MDDALHTLKSWVLFAGFVLVVCVLYWAQAILVPVALAILLTFVLSPAVTWFQGWIGRIPAVLVTVALAFTILGLAGWGLARQMNAWPRNCPAISTTSGRKSRTSGAPGRAGPSRNSRTR